MEFPKTTVKVKKIGLPILGAIAGFTYYWFVGCTNGACPMTGNPWISTLYGAFLGYLAGSSTSQLS